MSEAELNLSISAKENSCILRNSLERSSVANPTEALEETNTFVMLASSPATEIPSIQIPMRVTTAMSRCMTPSSTMRAISMGWSVSQTTKTNTSTGHTTMLHLYLPSMSQYVLIIRPPLRTSGPSFLQK